MGHLGDFGVEREPIIDTFGYFGETIRTNPYLTDIATFESFEAVHNSKTSSATIAALKGVIAVLVHPDDAERCWQTAVKNGQESEHIAELAFKLLEAASARPTKRPSVSSDGPSITEPSSEDDSVSPALTVLDGRPDLQVAVLRAAKAS